ncbi:MAG: 50S ribosomal protein L9 [Chitinispirillaceae bacterium]|jgi:large subunit ribosomal protein L9
MEIVLTKDFQDLGKAMDVLKVKDGFARNFLIPAGIAVPATEGNRKRVAEAKRIAELGEEKRLKEARQRAKKIEQVPCTIPVKVGEEDRIFGSVTAQEIAGFLQKEGFDIEKNNIELEEPIKQLGVYTVTVVLYKDVSAKLKVWVVKEEQK